jgi:hypothetical protein
VLSIAVLNLDRMQICSQSEKRRRQHVLGNGTADLCPGRVRSNSPSQSDSYRRAGCRSVRSMPLLAALWEVVWRSAHALEPPAPQRQWLKDVCDEEEEGASVGGFGQGASDPAPNLSGRRRFALRSAGGDKGKDGSGGSSKQRRVGGMPLVTVVLATAVGLPFLLTHVIRCAAASTRPSVMLRQHYCKQLRHTFTLGALLSHKNHTCADSQTRWLIHVELEPRLTVSQAAASAAAEAAGPHRRAASGN